MKQKYIAEANKWASNNKFSAPLSIFRSTLFASYRVIIMHPQALWLAFKMFNLEGFLETILILWIDFGQ